MTLRNAFEDVATEATLASLLTELGQKVEPADLAALATAARQDTGNTSLASILAKLSSDPATQTTLAAVLAKISADPATQTTLAAVLVKLTTSASSPLSTRLTDGTTYLGSTAQRLHVDDGGSTLSVDDGAGSLTVDGTVAVSSVPLPTVAASTPGNIRKTVTTAGTAVALNGSALVARYALVTALSTNAGVIVPGGSGVIAASGTRNGPGLNAGDAVPMRNVDLNAVYIDSTVNGEGVTVLYQT